MTNINGDSCDIYHNLIAENPLFVDTTALDFHLQLTSPCINAGDPALPHDPDNTIADIGALFYNLAGVQPFSLTLTPMNPPIIIAPQGGSFNFTASVERLLGPQAPITLWARIKYPNGTYTLPVLGPVSINPPIGVIVTRQRTQNIPGSYPPGIYTYLGYANAGFSYPTIDSSFFTFTKSAAGSGPFVWDATCIGEPFPGEEIPVLLQSSSFNLFEASPNPFNPTTTISYQLSTASHVSLRVYDAAGRVVATLVDGWREAGIHEVSFEASKLTSGLYFAHLSNGTRSQIEKLLLVK